MIISNKRSSRSIFYAARSDFFGVLRELNLFSDDPFWSRTLKYSEQILSTRLFLFFLFLSLLIITIYTSLTIRTHSVTLEQFSISDYEQIESNYPRTIYAPCTQVANPYSKLIHLNIKFHQICSSPFVDHQWISSLFLPNATSHNILDVRTFTFAQFQSLSLLCDTASQAINDGYGTFNSTQLITTYLRSRAEYNVIVNVLITNLRNDIIANENLTARIVSMNIAYNRLISALRTNFYIRYEPLLDEFITHNGIYLRKTSKDSLTCDCRLEGNQCTYPAGAFYKWTIPELDKPAKADLSSPFQIPGLMAGCLPLESIQQSTLQCLYSESCISILSAQSNISKPKPLEISLSNYSSNLTIGTLFHKYLFVESWKNRSNYEVYFNACAPRSLTYSYRGRYRLASIFTLCLSAFGGLVTLCKFLIPLIIKFCQLIKWKKQDQQPPNSTDEIEIEQITLPTAPKSINQAIIKHVKETISKLNFFPSNNKDDIEEEENVGIIATRLYILFLFFGLTILVFCTSLLKRPQMHTIHSPSINQFDRFKSLYGSDFICTCFPHSMSYGRILSISPQYHQICKSEFVKKSWLSYFDLREIKLNSTLFLSVDFRISGQSFFNFADALCRSAKETVENGIGLFRSRRLVTVNTWSRTQFHFQMKRRLKQFEDQTVASFVNLLQLIRSSIQTNNLVTDLLTNAGITFIRDRRTSKLLPRFYYQNLYNSSCSCAVSSECTRPQGFYLQSSDRYSDPKIVVPGLVLGCYTIDSLLLSTLQCFFEQKCLQLLIDSYHFDVIGLLHPLHNSTTRIRPLQKKTSRFPPNTTVKSIVSQLFIEDWRAAINFTGYYNRCAPKQCTYTVIKRFDWSYTIAMVLGLYNALTILLEISLLPLVRFIRQRSKKQLPRTSNPQIENDQICSSGQSRNCCSFRNMYQSLRSWNLFSTKCQSDDEQVEHKEIYAIRLYLILFILCLTIALLYAGPFSREIKIKKISFPTSDIVNDLRNKKLSTLSCPCSTAAIPYSKFLSIRPKYYSICFSKYVQHSYRINFFDKKNRTSLELNAHYRILATLCKEARRTIKNAQDIFYSHDLISVQAMIPSSFYSQTESLIGTFISQIPSDYRRTLTFIIRSFEVNHLFNILGSNWKLDLTNESEDNILGTYPRPFSSSNCSCATSFDCTEYLQENIVTGCFPFDGFRLSTFQNLSLGQFNDKLFVERWKNKSNYTDYFEICRPLECQYTLPDRNNLLIMLLTPMELYGGLTCVLYLIVGQSLRAYRWWLKKQIEGTVI